MQPYSPTAAATISRQYAIRFRSPIALVGRVRDLLARYPDVAAPNFLSWEGEGLTHCDTSAKLRNLLAALESAEKVGLNLTVTR